MSAGSSAWIQTWPLPTECQYSYDYSRRIIAIAFVARIGNGSTENEVS